MKRTTTSAVPYSDTLATQVMVDGFVLSSCDYKDVSASFDADGNQTLVKTSTGIWAVSYNAQNSPVRFTQGETIIECQYDSQGRRVFKKVSVAGAITLHHRYLYRGYVQIATIDMTRSGLNGLWMIFWDPSQPTATRPLAIQIAGTWFTYGLDLTKNVCELYKNNGGIATAYTYTPFGQATAVGTTTQPLGWSSEFTDGELDLVYYNYRHYNPQDGRWINRDPIGIQGGYNLYGFVGNKVSWIWDLLGREKGLTEYTVSLKPSAAVNNAPINNIPIISSDPIPPYLPNPLYTGITELNLSGKLQIGSKEISFTSAFEFNTHDVNISITPPKIKPFHNFTVSLQDKIKLTNNGISHNPSTTICSTHIAGVNMNVWTPLYGPISNNIKATSVFSFNIIETTTAYSKQEGMNLGFKVTGEFVPMSAELKYSMKQKTISGAILFTPKDTKMQFETGYQLNLKTKETNAYLGFSWIY